MSEPCDRHVDGLCSPGLDVLLHAARRWQRTTSSSPRVGLLFQEARTLLDQVEPTADGPDLRWEFWLRVGEEIAPNVCIPSLAQIWPTGEPRNRQKGGAAILPVSKLADRPDLQHIWAKKSLASSARTLRTLRGSISDFGDYEEYAETFVHLYTPDEMAPSRIRDAVDWYPLPSLRARRSREDGSAT